MLRTSSVKAFVISNLAQFVLATAISFLVLRLLWRYIGEPPITKGSWSTFSSAMMLTLLPVWLSNVVASLIAGFIAGRMAEYRPVLHGALASGVLFLLTLYSVLHTASLGAVMPSTILSLIAAFVALPAGALGGYGAAQTARGASRYDAASLSQTGFMERGLILKFLASLVLTICICAFIFFSPTILCHGGGTGGNCGEAYMLSIPAAFVLSPFIFAAALYVL